MKKNAQNIGTGAVDAALTAAETRAIVELALGEIAPGSKVLAIIPDTSRDDNTDRLFPQAYEILRSRGVARFDALVAQGTHAPISPQEKLAKIGLPDFAGEIFDHEWNNPAKLTSIGRFEAAEVAEATGGAFAEPVELTVNRLVRDYDVILVFGATVPHEVAGFSGGAKYFFPGISGAALTHATHWIGALAGIENIIGRIETPTRHLIEKAADAIEAEIVNFSSVVSRDRNAEMRTHGLFAGDFRESFRRAAELSRRLHVKYVGRKYRRVVALLDRHYTELWTGGKASYKLGGIIEEGGELIIYAPHLTDLSLTHSVFIEKFGYAPIERIRELASESAELRGNLCVAAHLAHVSYAGSRSDPKISKYAITLASGLDAGTCARVNLNYADHRGFALENYLNDPETLVVKNAGRDLYLLNKKSEQ